jgi:site-specific DNA recombinase
MIVPSWSKKYVCPKCRNKVPIEDLEAVFQEQLKQFFLSPEDVANYLGQADEVIRSKEEALESLRAEQERVQRERDRVYRAYVADELPMDAFGKAFRPLEERLKQIGEEMPRLQGEVDFLKIEALSRDEVLSGAQDLASRWPLLAFEEKRAIVEQVVEQVIVGKEDIEIRLLYVPPSPSQATTQRPRNRTDSSTPPLALSPGNAPSARRARP